MKSFLDSSVLVACFYGDHEHHDRSIRLLTSQKRGEASTAAHCLAEVFSVVTGMPGKSRASPDEALLFLKDMSERLVLVALAADEYVDLLEGAVASGISGGAIYDAIIARCALRSKSQAIYTWNKKDFLRLGADIAARAREP